jgi:hypothetical protein
VALASVYGELHAGAGVRRFANHVSRRAIARIQLNVRLANHYRGNYDPVSICLYWLARLAAHFIA